MHELAVAQALVEQVDAVIDQHGATQASLIRVRIGPLAGVVPELLATAFPLAAAGSRMEHAATRIQPRADPGTLPDLRRRNRSRNESPDLRRLRRLAHPDHLRRRTPARKRRTRNHPFPDP